MKPTHFAYAAACLGSLFAGQMAFAADGADAVHETHAYSNFVPPKYDADFAHLDYVNPDAPKGGEIALWAQGTFDSFNPYSRKGVPASLASSSIESILASTADDAYALYCYLCTTMEYPESLDWVIFNLRDDVTFSDGTPMTADDVLFSFEILQEQGISEYRAIIDGFFTGVEVLSPTRVKFLFSPDAPRADRIGFAGGQSVMSRAWFETTGTRLDESSTEQFLGTGPYALDSFRVNQQIIYARNPEFWGADHPLNVGQNNFDEIRIEYFADANSAFEAFKSGAYTFRIESSSKQWATGYDFPALDQGWVVQDTLPDGSIGSGQSFVFNLRKPEWQDPRVREAIGLMFNFEWSNETLFYGLYERVNSFWDNSPLKATGAPSEGEIALLQPLVDEGLLPEAILTDEAVMSPVSGARQLDRGNLRKASALLDEAGWIAGDDGMRRKDGKVLSLTVLQRSPLFDRVVNPFVDNLMRLGVAAELERVDNAQYVDRRRTGDFDLVNHGFTMTFEPGQGLRQWYGSETADDSSRNIMALKDPAVDRLIDAVTQADSAEALETSIHALDRVLRSLRFWVPQWFKNSHTIAYFDVFGRPETLPPFSLGHTSFWWYDADKADALRQAGALR